jgi:hypothetical protein
VLFYAHEVLLPALGWHLSWHLRDLIGVNGASALAGGLIAIVLGAAAATQAGRCRAFVLTAVAASLAFATFTSAFAWTGPILAVSLLSEPGARYSTLPILLLDAALIVAVDACARRWWPRPRAVVAVVALVAVLGAGWATDFRYPVLRLELPGPWQMTASEWLRYCQEKPSGSITVTFPDYWDPAPLANTFSCARLRR